MSRRREGVVRVGGGGVGVGGSSKGRGEGTHVALDEYLVIQ